LRVNIRELIRRTNGEICGKNLKNFNDKYISLIKKFRYCSIFLFYFKLYNIYFTMYLFWVFNLKFSNQSSSSRHSKTITIKQKKTLGGLRKVWEKRVLKKLNILQKVHKLQDKKNYSAITQQDHLNILN